MYILTLLLLLQEAINYLDVGLAAAVAVLAALLAAGLFGPKLAAVLDQVNEAMELLRQAKSAKGPGGTKITRAERDQLMAKALDVLQEVWTQYGGGILQRIGNLFRKVKRE